MIAEPKREILLGPLVRAGLQRSWAARDHFLRLAIVPLAIILAILVPFRELIVEVSASARPNEIPEGSGTIMLLAVAVTAAVAVFVVNWIRQLTLGMQGAPGLGLSLSGRHLRFVLLALATSIGNGILAVILVLILAGFGMPGAMAGLQASLLIWAALIVRISPTWIGIALDAPMPLRISWQRTAGQGFKLLIALLVIEVPAMLASHLVEIVFGLTGLGAAAPLTFALISVVIQLIGIAVQLAILVTAFPYFLRETV